MSKGFRFVPGIGLVLGALCVGGCKPETGASSGGNPTVPVKTGQVEVREFSDKVEALGTVRALEATDISSTVTDRIEELFFEDGDSVKEGDLLVRLESDEEKAAVGAAIAELEEQEREIKRLKSLVEEGAVSEVRFEEYRTQQKVAEQQVEEAKARLADREIKAPFDGTLGFRRVSKGALVTPGDLIATLDILDPVRLDFSVPETFLADLRPGLEITALADAFPGKEFSGTVTQIDTRVNPVTRSVTVRAEIPNKEKLLRPGMLMTTALENNPKNSLSIPERALVSVQSNHFAFVVSSGEAGEMSVKRTAVSTGRRLPGYVEITDGLKEGHSVVTDGLVGLMDGAEVKVIGEFEGPSEPYRPTNLGN